MNNKTTDGEEELSGSNLFRSFSDSRLGRKYVKNFFPNETNDDGYVDDDDDEEYEFLKIDSDYNYAIEEVCDFFGYLIFEEKIFFLSEI